MGLYRDEVEEVLSELIVEGFVNEERYAKAYAGGKFRIKRWGKNRIIRELEAQQISPYCIRKALEEIDPEDYLLAIKEQILKRSEALSEVNLFKKREKIVRHLLYRGFEGELAWDLVKEMVAEE